MQLWKRMQTLWVIFNSCMSGAWSACPARHGFPRVHRFRLLRLRGCTSFQGGRSGRRGGKEGYIAPRGSLWLVLIQSKCGLG